MWELYLISRLDYLTAAAWTIFGIVALTFVVLIVTHLIMDDGDLYNHEKHMLNNIKKGWKTCLWIMIPCFIIGISIPNKNDALIILGVGTVVDYVQDNKTLQEMPDKCVQALDIWLDDKLSIKNDTIK